MVLIISLLVAILILLLLFIVMRSKFTSGNQVHQRLRDLQGVTSHVEEMERMPFMERTVKPFLRDIVGFLVRFAPSSIHDAVEHKIVLAGKQDVWSANGFIALWLLSMVAFFFLANMMTSRNPAMPYLQKVIFFWLFVAMGAFFPFMILNSIIRKRQKLISKQLPEVLDLLSVSVQAGLSFDGSVRRIIERMTGPLIDEFRHVYRDVQMGSPRARALQAMARRCDVDDVYVPERFCLPRKITAQGAFGKSGRTGGPAGRRKDPDGDRAGRSRRRRPAPGDSGRPAGEPEKRCSAWP